MADKPIIFSAPMVRALLDGRKTQTRRVLKPLPRRTIFFDPQKAGADQFQEPHYATGDRLWVREAFTTCEKHKFMIAYRADGECGAWCWDGDGKPIFIHHGHVLEASPRGQWGFARYGGRWRSPIHMPRWASRLTLTVTDVRVQRLQEISEADALAEGVPHIHEGNIGDEPYCSKCEGHGVHGAFGAGYGVAEVDCSECVTARQKFRNLWSSLHGPGAWEANPWVAAYSFTVQRGNIDRLQGDPQ